MGRLMPRLRTYLGSPGARSYGFAFFGAPATAY
jgi:hypothetical protein